MKIGLDREFIIEEEVLFADFLRQKGSYYQAERIAKEHYTKEGYFVLYCPSLKDLLSGDLGYDKTFRGEEFHKNYKSAMEILSEKLEILFYIDAIFRGFPDLIVFDLKNKSFFLVETKRNDHIMDNQVIFFILARDIFNICDIKLVRVKPNGSYVREKKPMKFTLRKTFDSYLQSFNKRRLYEIKKYREIDAEEASSLKESLKTLSKQKKILNNEFFDDRAEKIKNRIEFLNNINYHETHSLSNMISMWSSWDYINIDKKYMRKLARKVLTKRSVNYEHNERVKMISRGKKIVPKQDRSYLRLSFNPN